ncbi:hypothetical protein ACLX1H_009332 [Fusarium chlamydosporum]
MRFVAILVASTASLVSAGCFTHGDEWGEDRFTALAAAQRLCEDGTFNIEYERADVKYKCVNLSSLKKADFTIIAQHNILTGDRLKLGSEDCTKYFHNEINGCSRGGQGPLVDFYKSDDPKYLLGTLQFT